MLSAEARRDVAKVLASAERERSPVPPLRTTWPDLDVVDAYTIQLLNIAERREAGATVRGHKVGLSSLAMQEMMGVDEPDYGHLLSDMEIPASPGGGAGPGGTSLHGAQRGGTSRERSEWGRAWGRTAKNTVSASRYCMPRVEVEVAYVLGKTLPGHGCTEADVIDATDHVTAAIELIDSRIAGWDIKITDTIADNASSAGFVLGTARVDPATVDLTIIEARLLRGGEEVAAGRSDAVLGDPTTAVAWLARKVASFGVTLEAGHVILPGSVHRAVDAAAGDEFEAVFADSVGTSWGSVRLSFTE
ncbi:2-keto-4-pentenoate hydratase [Aeromicrobium sp. CTD01-1L150]|uniref:2-keto-4-pentenoate hydratase n=1 Tax=Aeromicrobium sp. CTD01-1L150 TaxID=3341830 RepID=UPI0035C20A6E